MINRGNILCSPEDLCATFDQIIAEVQILELPETKPLMASGYTCVMHFHTTIEECQLDLICEIDKKTKEEKKVKFLKSFSRARILIKTTNLMCGEKFERMPTLGRFTLRDEGKTISIGKILKYKLSK